MPPSASVELPDKGISFNDTDGDAIVFRRKTGKIYMYVNGDLAFSDLTSLELKKGYICFKGAGQGQFSGKGSGTCKPSVLCSDPSVIEKVLALHRGDQPQVKLLAAATLAAKLSLANSSGTTDDRPPRGGRRRCHCDAPSGGLG